VNLVSKFPLSSPRARTPIHGTPEQVRERLKELVAAGTDHLPLNPISRHAEQLEAVAELAGLK
jgi:alkanesulfonate monooxygenase SsuD/methylene tetrahydromethanopterin reductase-like flavin-dependent oxidoreductase (luciferase family)